MENNALTDEQKVAAYLETFDLSPALKTYDDRLAIDSAMALGVSLRDSKINLRTKPAEFSTKEPETQAEPLTKAEHHFNTIYDGINAVPFEGGDFLDDTDRPFDKKQIVSPNLTIVARELPEIINLSSNGENLAESLKNLARLEKRKVKLQEILDKLRSQEYFARKLNETNVRFEEANNVSIKDITAKIKSLEAVPFIDKTQATRAELVYYRDTIKTLEESVDDLKNLIQQAIKKSIGEMQLFDLQIGAINTDQYKLINQKYNNN